MNKHKKIKIAVAGDFAFGSSVYSGQTAKTRDYHYYLCKRYGEENVVAIDTRDWKKRLVPVLFTLFKSLFTCNRFVMLLCTNGRRTLLPFVMSLRKLFGYRVYFPAVGGTLYDEFADEKVLQNCFDKIDAVYLETKKLLNFFLDQGYTNCYYAPVFSKRDYHNPPFSWENPQEPLPLCTYSRVCKEKGISDAIDAVVEVNRRAGRTVCTLDIFGAPAKEYEEEFNQKLEQAKDCVHNLGLLTDANAIDELSAHYLMLFPTYYDGEGFPIALIECFKAGLPVIATDWHFNAEIVQHGKTGMIYSLDHKELLTDYIETLLQDADRVREMKKNCLEEAKKFDPEVILSHLFAKIEE